MKRSRPKVIPKTAYQAVKSISASNPEGAAYSKFKQYIIFGSALQSVLKAQIHRLYVSARELGKLARFSWE